MPQASFPASKMAPAATQQTAVVEEVGRDSNSAHNEEPGDPHERMAQAVAKVLLPTIIETVDEAVHKSLHSIQMSMEVQVQRITETESCISLMEEDIMEFHSHNTNTEATIKTLLEKIDDLENRSRRNNLRIIGIPESYKATYKMRLCIKAIPKALGLHNTMPVERAHCLGPFQQERKSPRAAIAAFLNYTDKTQLLQRFRNKRSLVVEAHSLLLFVDYSAEVSKNVRPSVKFSHPCLKNRSNSLCYTQANFRSCHKADVNSSSRTQQKLKHSYKIWKERRLKNHPLSSSVHCVIDIGLPDTRDTSTPKTLEKQVLIDNAKWKNNIKVMVMQFI